jgi:hypothetical protein
MIQVKKDKRMVENGPGFVIAVPKDEQSGEVRSGCARCRPRKLVRAAGELGETRWLLAAVKGVR